MTDEEAIRRLLARFVQLRDDKRFDSWSDLFTEDAVFSYGEVRLEGRGFAIGTMGRYVDQLVREGGAWRIRRRDVVLHAGPGGGAEA